MKSVLIRLAAIAGVFVIAVAVRWPSCGDSFWVDELHTAWCIDGTFDQVGERATIGNQQPFYFGALSMWQRCLPTTLVAVYGIEAALRATSVLLTALSAAWLVAIVGGARLRKLAKRGESSDNAMESHTTIRSLLACNGNVLVGGAAAGLALAIDRDAIFFGTELRPYAAVIFLTTAALALARRLIEQEAPGVGSCTDEDVVAPATVRAGGCAMRVALHGLVLIAAAIHITSLIVLAPQMLVFTVSDMWRHRTASRSRLAVLLTHGGAGLAWVAVAILWSRSHAGLWQSRGNWGSFATVNGWSDVWQIWPWWALVVLPIAGWATACRLRGASFRDAIGQRDVMMASLILAGVIGSTLACYLLSACAGIPLWHRRYLIASLPMLCAVMGWFIGAIDNSEHAVPGSPQITSMKRRVKTSLERFGFPVYRVGLVVVCLLLLTYRQGTLTTWYRGESQLIRRGENWKTAVAMVRNSAVAGDQVWVDAGLIEQEGQPTLVTDLRMEEYLRYVTAGPYRLGRHVHPIGIGRGAISAWLDPHAHGVPDGYAASRFLITRRRSRRVNHLPAEIAAYRFGSVTVLLRK